MHLKLQVHISRKESIGNLISSDSRKSSMPEAVSFDSLLKDTELWQSGLTAESTAGESAHKYDALNLAMCAAYMRHFHLKKGCKLHKDNCQQGVKRQELSFHRVILSFWHPGHEATSIMQILGLLISI